MLHISQISPQNLATNLGADEKAVFLLPDGRNVARPDLEPELVDVANFGGVIIVAVDLLKIKLIQR